MHNFMASVGSSEFPSFAQVSIEMMEIDTLMPAYHSNPVNTPPDFRLDQMDLIRAYYPPRAVIRCQILELDEV